MNIKTISKTELELTQEEKDTLGSACDILDELLDNIGDKSKFEFLFERYNEADSSFDKDEDWMFTCRLQEIKHYILELSNSIIISY